MPRRLNRPGGTVPVTISGRDENPGETRLTLNLGAANLDLAAIQIETSEPLFTRQVTLAVPQVDGGYDSRTAAGPGVIYRVAVEGQPASSNLTVPWKAGSLARIAAAHQKSGQPAAADHRGARGAASGLPGLPGALGRHLPFADRQQPLRRAALRSWPRWARTSSRSRSRRSKFSPLADNPNYRPPEVLAGIQDGGTALDVSAWKFRKAVKLSRAGAQRIELDLDVLSHAQPGLRRPAPAARRQAIALHPGTHVHQPRADADGHHRQRQKGPANQPLDHQAAAQPVCPSPA